MQTTQKPATLRWAVSTHVFLCAGVVATQAIIAFLFWLKIAPLGLDSYSSFPLASISAGIGIAGLGMGLLIRTRVPQVSDDATLESHWTSPQTIRVASISWFGIEGGAMLNAVSFLWSGSIIPGAISVIALVVLLLSGPRRLTPDYG